MHKQLRARKVDAHQADMLVPRFLGRIFAANIFSSGLPGSPRCPLTGAAVRSEAPTDRREDLEPRSRVRQGFSRLQGPRPMDLPSPDGSVAGNPQGFDRAVFLERMAQESIAFFDKNLR